MGIAFDDEGNVIKQANVFLVCGSPASGKTTYVAQHKSGNDLVVDLDYLCAALNGETGNVHLNHAPILSVALEVRELLYQIIQARRGRWERAFVITTDRRHTGNESHCRRIAGGGCSNADNA